MDLIGWTLGSSTTGNVRFTSSQIADLPLGGVFSASAVPEPASWSLLLLGFGSIGRSLRNRQAIAARA
jgi:hypothetical protein